MVVRRTGRQPFSHYSHETRKEAMVLSRRKRVPREIVGSLGLANLVDEFGMPCEKCHLFLILDCFDGRLVS